MELTLGFNQNLYQHYPYYFKMINGLDFDDTQCLQEQENDRDILNHSQSILGWMVGKNENIQLRKNTDEET